MSEETTNKFQPNHGFFQVTIVVNAEDPESGKEKKQKEIHLVDAVSPSDVETKVAKEMEGTMWEWEITEMKRSKIQIIY